MRVGRHVDGRRLIRNLRVDLVRSRMKHGSEYFIARKAGPQPTPKKKTKRGETASKSNFRVEKKSLQINGKIVENVNSYQYFRFARTMYSKRSSRVLDYPESLLQQAVICLAPKKVHGCPRAPQTPPPAQLLPTNISTLPRKFVKAARKTLRPVFQEKDLELFASEEPIFFSFSRKSSLEQLNNYRQRAENKITKQRWTSSTQLEMQVEEQKRSEPSSCDQ